MNGKDGNGSMARAVNLVASAWLFISSFMWWHGAAQRADSAIVGIVAFLITLYSLGVDPRARHVNTLLAIWLFISTLALPAATAGTVLSNVIVAVVLFVASLLRSRPPGEAPRPRHA